MVADATGALRVFKAPSTPGSFERGFIDVLEVAAEHYGLDLRSFLGRVESIVHGSTVSTNALVEGKTRPVGFVTNAGFPDTLTLREAPRKRSFEWRLRYPEPYVPRNRTCTVRGRIAADGSELVPLDEADVHAAIAHFRKVGVEAVGVCFLWSIANGAHERRVREIIRAEWPGVPVTLSHELNPIPREYRRAISAVIDASLSPIVSSYVQVLQEALQTAGYTRELLMANCVGGMMPPDEIVRKPIYSVMSGPTLAPIAAQHLTDEQDVIVGDMGGTTFDVSAIRGGQLVVTAEAMIGDDMLGIPKVDVRSIGAGGGSIAWVDVGGLLRVGPQSAGARPGPACYGLGGEEPTVTDANVVLGVIDPDYFLGGRIRLDRAAAEAAVRKIADTLSIGLIDAAYAIHTTSNHNMITAIEDITIREGINPRDSYLVCGGGATACHIGEMASVLGIKRLMIPKFAAGLSAFGGLISDVRWEESATLHTDQRRFDLDGVNKILEGLRQRGVAFLDRAGIAPEDRRFAYVYLGRYEYQSWEIEVPFELDSGAIAASDIQRLVKAFHDTHYRIYTIKDEDDTVEFTTWKVRAIGVNTQRALHLRQSATATSGAATPKSTRPVHIHSLGGMTDVPVYEGDTLGVGARIEGPAIIEEQTFTSLLLDRQSAEVDALGNYLVRLG
ncbi:MAG: hydantoinase/oxoprolinase family protein [Alphaproteobacteria bacterium]